jgi:protein-tyrosine phosphatase
MEVLIWANATRMRAWYHPVVRSASVLDAHTHVLPGLDDGVQTLPEALACLRGLFDLGFTHVVASPHFYPGLYTASVQEIDPALETLRGLLTEQGIPLALLRGRECLLDFALTTSPERDTFPFEWKGRRYQLIELPQVTPRSVISPYLAALRDSRVQPVLAHAERVSAIARDPERVRGYLDLGFSVQVDLASFSPEAHKDVRGAALRLAEWDCIHMIGSDIHRPAQLKRVREGLEFLRTEFGKERLARYGDPS